MTITLDLPETLTAYAREVAEQTGRTVEDVLVEWLNRGAHDDGLIDAHTAYHLYTPYGNEHAADILMDALKAAQEADEE